MSVALAILCIPLTSTFPPNAITPPFYPPKLLWPLVESPIKCLLTYRKTRGGREYHLVFGFRHILFLYFRFAIGSVVQSLTSSFSRQLTLQWLI